MKVFVSGTAGFLGCDVGALTRFTKGADLVYHCAAIPTELLSVFSPAIITKHVYENTAGILAAAATNRVKRFVFCWARHACCEGGH